MDSPRIHPETLIGCVCLKVANVERSLGFYRDVVGFKVTQRYGKDAVCLSAVGHHHQIGPHAWVGRNVPIAPASPPASSTSLSSTRSATCSPGR